MKCLISSSNFDFSSFQSSYSYISFHCYMLVLMIKRKKKYGPKFMHNIGLKFLFLFYKEDKTNIIIVVSGSHYNSCLLLAPSYIYYCVPTYTLSPS